jgi:4-amino-4-deoxy-L-arabinose transferase-like glycosyltransferase
MGRNCRKTSLWPYFAGATILVIMAAAIRWSFEHPYGTSWDEAGYINEVLFDAQRLVHGMLFKLAGRIMIRSYGRPPAYRILALPFLAVFGFHVAAARLSTLACFALSAWFIYRATRRLSGDVSGAFAVFVFSLSPIVVSASIWFSTEGPLYLATSAFFYYLIAIWVDQTENRSTWIGLGITIALGFLSKASYAAVVLPVLAFWFIAALWGKLSLPRSLTPLIKAVTLAFVLAAPWWALNFRAAMDYTQYARGYVANSLGAPSFLTWAKWLNTVCQSLLGYGLVAIIGLIGTIFFWEVVIKRQSILSLLQKAVLCACACGGLPIVIAQLSGTNDLLRHISPAVVPLAIAVGVVGETTGWMRQRLAMASSAVLFCGQMVMLVAPAAFPNTRPMPAGFANAQYPWTIMDRRDQWDWNALRDISDSIGCANPTISYLGYSTGLTPPEIAYPWVAESASTSDATLTYPQVNWLWRYEDGPIDWQKVLEAADSGDIVITAPKYAGVSDSDHLDNQHNGELADRLAADPRFRTSLPLTVGRFDPIEVLVFVKETPACASVSQGNGEQQN